MTRTVHSLFAAVLAIAAWTSASGQTLSSDPIDIALAKQYFDEAKALSDADGGAMWGVELYGPMIFVEPHSRSIVTNAPDTGRHLRAHDGVYVGTLPDAVNIANTTTNWAGVQWAMIIWPLPQHEQERGLLMMHESFHRIQNEIGIEMAIRNNHHLDSADGRIWQRLEWRALAAALEDENPLASEALRDAIIFRAWRRKTSKNAASEENPVELNEGLAEYTGVRLSGYARDKQIERTRERLLSYERMTSFSRSFAYATGPAYGLLLDEVDPGWRKKVEPGADLGAMLARAIEFRMPRNIRAEAESRAERYDGESIIAAEREAEEARTARIEELRREFVDGPALRVPMSGDTQFSFSPHGVEALPGVGSVYQSMRISGDFGVLESSRSVLWINEQHPNNQFRIPVSAEPAARDDGSIAGDGWTLRLNEGWRLRKITARGDYAIERR